MPEDNRIPIHDEDDYDDGQHEARSVPIEEREPYEEPPSPYTDSHDEAPSHDEDPENDHDHRDLDVTSPEPQSLAPPSPSSAAPVQGERVYPARLSVASAIHPELSSPHIDYLEWEEAKAMGSGSESHSKKNGESSTALSRWDKVKNTLMRTNSSQGRRSRTNSIRERERTPNTDSSVTRESGASLTSSSQTDKGDKNGDYFFFRYYSKLYDLRQL